MPDPRSLREHNRVLAEVKYIQRRLSMKQPSRLTWKQKQIVNKAGKNPEDYMLHSEDEKELILYNRKEKRLEAVEK